MFCELLLYLCTYVCIYVGSYIHTHASRYEFILYRQVYLYLCRYGHRSSSYFTSEIWDMAIADYSKPSREEYTKIICDHVVHLIYSKFATNAGRISHKLFLLLLLLFEDVNQLEITTIPTENDKWSVFCQSTPHIIYISIIFDIITL